MKKSIEAFKKMSRKNKMILVSILSGIILIFGATTFAFFSSSINGEKQPLSVTTGTLRLDFNDIEGSGIIEGEMGIGKTVSKRMMISNTGTQDATATIMWNELENTYLAKSLKYTIKQTHEYDINQEVDVSTLEYNQEVPEAGIYVPRGEEPKKTALTRGILIPAGKKIYYEVTITYNHLDDIDQNVDLEARLYTSFTIEEGEQLEPFTITKENRNLLGITGAEEELIIPSTYQDENGIWYKVSSIANITFSGCTSLTSITIPDSVTSIGATAFNNCSSLISINVDENNNSYESIDGVLFTSDKKTLVQCPKGKAESYIIPDHVENISAVSFQNCKSLTSITIPNSVTNIGNNAFQNCIGLTSITIPSHVKVIKNYTFSGCRQLTSITIPDGVTSIGGYAFSGCRGLTSITIPNSVTTIGNYAFSGCSGLTSATILNDVDTTFIFSSCINLSTINLGSEVKNFICRNNIKSMIAINVDENNQTYKSIDGVLFTKDGKTLVYYPGGKTASNYVIPNSVTNLGNRSFFGCSSLTSIIIPNSVINIGDDAFVQCNSLTSITLPDSVTSIGESVFSYCSVLTLINVDENNPSYKSIDGVLFTKDGKTLVQYPRGKTDASYIIPDSVTNIGDYAFYYCTELTSVTIPENVTRIGEYTFRFCTGLTTIAIPSNITSIGNYAFDSCSKLASAVYKNTTYTKADPLASAFRKNNVWYGGNFFSNTAMPWI